MKKYLIFIACVVLAACTKEEASDLLLADGQYSMTVKASKIETKALELVSSTINATWAEGDKVYVHNDTRNAELEGYLEAQRGGSSTTLKGELTGTIEANDRLTLKFLSPSYGAQNGTLEYIASHCDYAEATVTVESKAGGNITIKENSAEFENQQAIVKFTLIDKTDGSTLLTPTALTVNDGSRNVATLTGIPVATYITNGNGVLYVAIPGITDKAVQLTATMGGGAIHMYQKPGITFGNSQYYEVTVTMPKLYAASNITVLTGKTGERDTDEGIENLLDGNKTNKWCSVEYGPPFYSNRIISQGAKDQVIWKTASSIILTNYMLTTGNDTYNSERNWKSWSIYGANYSNDDEATTDDYGWTLIQQIENDDVLQAVNFTDFWFSIPDNNTAYQYYRLVIDATTNDSNVHQMSEMTLLTK